VPITVQDDRTDLDLLMRYNPEIVVFPQEHSGRARPGAKRPGTSGWGDYHPCSAEFFLDHVALRAAGKPFSFKPWDLVRSRFFRRDPAETPTTIEKIRKEVRGVRRQDDTRDWELDVAQIPSQDGRRAWERYKGLLADFNAKGGAVVYGRVVRTWSGTALQYWYLYLFNDFANKHEGDWEQVTIALDGDDRPVRVGYSSHLGGGRRCWDHAPKTDDGHPILYVARGSHAGYFEFKARGHEAKFDIDKVVPGGLGPLVKLVDWSAKQARKIPVVRQRLDEYEDHVPAHPDLDDGVDATRRGVKLRPDVNLLPVREARKDDERWWWLWMRSRWGSSHARAVGGSGPFPPWVPGPGVGRWTDPGGWLSSLEAGGPCVEEEDV
jgi:hypothetical protein